MTRPVRVTSRPPTAGTGRLVTACLTAALLTGSCSLLDRGPSAEDAAGTLASGLTRGELAEVRFQGVTSLQAQERWDTTTSGLGGATRQVRAEDVVETDGTATATLAWSWTLPGTTRRWTYRSRARLVEGDGDDAPWRVALAPTLVHPDLAAGQRLVAERTAPDRGDILGAGGDVLVTERPVLRFGIDKTLVAAGRQPTSARALARVLDLGAEDYVDRVAAAGPRAFVEAVVLRTADARPVLTAARSVPGAVVVDDELPLAPTRDFARPLLGTVGPVTREIVEDSGGVYRAGDEAGLSGLQARYDEQLRGAPGVAVRVVAAGDGDGPDGGPDGIDADERGDRDGTPETGAELFSVPATPGAPLRTTLDPRLQLLAETTLAEVGPASALVALRPATGDLLAVASGPGAAGYSTATVGRYAPGSTFKVVSSLALLRGGLTPAATVPCPATTVVDGKRFKNYDDYPPDGLGTITLATAVANSCNTAFVSRRSLAPPGRLAEAAAALGLGVDHDLGFPAYLGSVPATPAEAGSETGHAAAMIGQGTVLASPMAMATVAASVGRGATVVPRLLLEGDPVRADPAEPLTRTEATRLRRLLRGVVTRGSGALLADLPGPPVLAKTGTAEFGTKTPLRTHAWMIAVQGDLAVAAFVAVGDSGSGTAGPLLADFLRGARRGPS